MYFYGADIDPNGDYGLNVNDFYAVDANGNGGGINHSGNSR